ncbi:MAG: glutamate-5-semialdehyde dehydrogenase [Deltaproteobacteria bacterium]|nr:glutamate-5-semialdehyde dehydrogenase [Deltaproteobacteria bacterium]MBW2448109.1 glutamate-5-semialdehyde dehydrogenase [Deltaproteobacteria bacterium]
MSASPYDAEIEDICRRAKAASLRTADLSTRVKNDWLERAAVRLEAAKSDILAANTRDVEAAEQDGVAEPMVRRLALAGDKWRDMIAGLRDVAALPDPVGAISELRVRPNGLRVGRMRIPLGVIGMIYESRPNVTVDAAALCVKAGNAVVLRGGSEAIHSNLALADELRAAARDVGLPEDAIGIFRTTDRAAIAPLLKADRYVDLMIPRGGPGLIRHVMEQSSIPVIAHDMGVCHIFIDETAQPDMARDLVLDSKLRQMAVCNGLETLLCHRAAARTVLPVVLKALHEEGVELRGCAETREVFPEAVAASEADWAAEYLDKILAVRIVDGLDAAVSHIQEFGSDHTEVIVTESYSNAQAFLRRVNSSAVGVNCSTAFADGFRLGLGAEIGVSTTKLHSFGPMGLEDLTTRKFVLYGEGQLRE